MIETCPKKRMVLGITLLTMWAFTDHQTKSELNASYSVFAFSVTILVLIVESHWAEYPRQQRKPEIIENNSTCWQREKYIIIKDCHPCTGELGRKNILNFHWHVFIICLSAAFEITSKSIGVCIHTNNKEVLRCRSGETVTRRQETLNFSLILFEIIQCNFSCDRVAWVDERNYWTFESVLFVVATLSTGISLLRQRSLDHKAMMKVQRQLEQSV